MVSPASPLVETALLCLLMILLLHKVICCIEDSLALQKDIDLLTSWINEHNLTLNVRKCKSLYISRKALYLSGQTIEISRQDIWSIYATPVWDPHLSKDMEAIESVQRFATRMCTKQWRNVNYQDRLKLMNLKTLHARRQHLKLCYLYKIINGQSYFVNPPLSYFSSAYNTRSHSLTLNIPFTR